MQDNARCSRCCLMHWHKHNFLFYADANCLLILLSLASVSATKEKVIESSARPITNLLRSDHKSARKHHVKPNTVYKIFLTCAKQVLENAGGLFEVSDLLGDWNTKALHESLKMSSKECLLTTPSLQQQHSLADYYHTTSISGSWSHKLVNIISHITKLHVNSTVGL